MSGILQGSGTTGDFVLNNQTVATDEGFRNVSKIWYDQTISYDQGLEQIQGEVDKREDIKCDPSAMLPVMCEETGKLMFEFEDGRRFTPTVHALRQYGTQSHVPHTFINQMTEDVYKPNGQLKFRRDAGDHAALHKVLLNGHRRVQPRKGCFIRTYTDGTLRAWLTGDYSPIDNRWYIEQLRNILPGGRLSHWRGDADTIYGNVLIPDTVRKETDSEYGGMISLSNCEIGKRNWLQWPSLFRAICMNGCIWDRTSGWTMKRVHRGKIDLVDLSKQLRANITDQIPLVTVAMAKVADAQTSTFNLATPKQMMATIAKQFALSKRQLLGVAEQYVNNSDATRFGMIDAITRQAQLEKPSDWVKLDSVGGDLLSITDNRWNALTTQAANMDEKQVAKAFGEKVLAS